MLTYDEFNFSYEKHDDDGSSRWKDGTQAAWNATKVGVVGGSAAAVAGGVGYLGYKTHKLIKGSNDILSEHGVNNPKTLHMLHRDDLGFGEKRKMKKAFKSILRERAKAAKAGDVQRAAEFGLAAKRMAHLVR